MSVSSETVECGVCYDPKDCGTSSCCGKPICRDCFRTWKNQSSSSPCAFCRTLSPTLIETNNNNSRFSPLKGVEKKSKKNGRGGKKHRSITRTETRIQTSDSSFNTVICISDDDDPSSHVGRSFVLPEPDIETEEQDQDLKKAIDLSLKEEELNKRSSELYEKSLELALLSSLIDQ